MQARREEEKTDRLGASHQTNELTKYIKVIKVGTRKEKRKKKENT